MEKRKFGKTDMDFSVLGFGGAEIGFNPQQTQEDVNQLLNSALDAGLNLIDTAAGYLKSEQMIGEAVGKRRKEFYLITKCGALDGFTRSDWSVKGILATIETSLKNLKTDYLDIAQLHSCDTEILKRGDAIEGLQRAQEKGYTRYIGYSGDNDDARYAIETDVFDSLQTSVSVADQTPIDTNIKLAATKNIGVIAKRPIANAVWRHDAKPESSYHHEYWDRIQKLKFDFLNKSTEEATAIALRFTLSIPGVHTMIVGTTRPNRWQENAKYIAEGELSGEEYEAIRNRWKEVGGDDWVGMT
ncbi:MAG: Oxidoreductase, aldo/keto reductase family [uncultured Pyrinomonadaceae bacterium]|uniref:Oxidoreductase, aldo/keto reductase family n=1 Tax=uncultured Pyrinomonadaceae bacterium TaxID=2283094 RepID=A0A6J4PAJ3_9BACT|nr:MAG: Oxidoreductase, aldo/keto reductase family [uncultured Pyrinomonadaceae bacterium]